jgi:class 3 adenylate cyclase/tetratricopeptide (TPR) repeat protein
MANSFMPVELAAKLNAARDTNAMAGERRVVTMLFCDIQGSTEAAGGLDPEEWTAIMNEAFEFMIQPVYRYEGTVARLMGDAILAFFGAPIAHEDDPQRAILAGLDIISDFQPYRAKVLAEWGVEFNVRVGINTGLVVVGAVGSDLRMEYTALGDAINLAARMEQTAQPGTVQIAEETYKLVAPIFDFEELGEITVKGKAEPVLAFRVLGRKARPGRTRGIAGLESPVVGRDPELGLLRRVFTDLHNGRGQILSVIGEAGLGKSRLNREAQAIWMDVLGREANGSGNPPLWTMSHGISFETHVPYGHWQQHIRQVCSIEEADPVEVVREKIAHQLTHWTQADRGQVGRVYRQILGIPEESTQNGEAPPDLLKQELFANLLKGFRMAAENAASGRAATAVNEHWNPPVIAFDDLHWADPASVELLTHLFQLSNEVPILFLLIFRPERQSSAWEARQVAAERFGDRYTEINLRPLSSNEGDEMVNHLLHVAELPSNWRDFIQDRADGNPFFLEELVRTLIDEGHIVRTDGQDGIDWRGVGELSEISVPDNLQNLLMSRIDRLNDEARQVLQMASVIGRKFYFRVLEIICQTIEPLESRLGELQKAELIREASRLPELEFMFRHTFTQETTYKSILRQHRRQFHLQVGEALETLFPDRIDEFATLLAQHFDEGEGVEKALHYHLTAAENAFALDAQVEALRHYERAIELSGTDMDEETLILLYRKRGRSLELQGRPGDALESYEQMVAVAEVNAQESLRLNALIAQGTLYSTATPFFDPDKSLELHNEAFVLAGKLEDEHSLASIYWNELNRERLQGHSEAAVAAGQKAVTIAEKHGYKLILAYAKNDLGHALRSINSAAALASFREGIEMWRQLKNRPMLTDGLGSLATYAHLMGDYDTAVEAAQESLEISQAIDHAWGESFSSSALGIVKHQQAHWEEAIVLNNYAVQKAEESDFRIGWMFSYIYFSDIFLRLGQWDLAEAQVEIMLDNLNNIANWMVTGTQAQCAKVMAMVGKLEQAEALLDAVQEQDRGPELGQVNYMVGEVQVFYSIGRHQELLDMAESLIEDMITMEAKPYLVEVLAVLSLNSLKLDRFEEGLRYADQALELSEGTGMRSWLWDILAVRADHLEGLGQEEEAAQTRTRAAQVRADIADELNNPDFKASFLARTAIKPTA